MIKKIIAIIIILYLLLNKNILNWSIDIEKCNLHHLKYRELIKLETYNLNQYFNPSITRFGNKFIHCARQSTYTSKNILRHLYGKCFYDSSIFFYETDINFKKVHIINVPAVQNLYLEDPRILYFNNLYYISCTLLKNKKDIYPVLLVYNTSYNYIRKIEYKGYIDEKIPRMYKNWCPFVKDEKIFLHTDTYPKWRVYSLNDNGQMKLEVENDSVKFFNMKNDLYLRCSTSWKRYDNNSYICALHTKSKGFYKKIRTIFVLIDKRSLFPIKKTPIICLDNVNHTRIQFISGLEIDDNGDILISYGIGDYMSITSKIKRTSLDKLFN